MIFLSLPFSFAFASTKIMILGDSITAGYGLAQKDALPVRLEKAITKALPKSQITVINAGVSGDTTAGGKARLDWLLFDQPDAVIVALGGNDTLRGLQPESSKKNLYSIIQSLQQSNIPILLTGMQAPRNMGDDFAQRFNAIFPDLATEFNILFYPFLLNNVATIPSLNQPDGIHPNPKGVDVIVEGILPKVMQLIAKTKND